MSHSRVVVRFDSTWLTALDNTVQLPTTVTEKECAILLQMAHFLLQRQLWDDMLDSEWDDLFLDISTAIYKLNSL